MKTQTITIIGLERTGASIGLAIKQSELEVTVVGHDRDMNLAQEAEKGGMVDEVQRNLPRAAAIADILILTVPISELEETLSVIGEDVQRHTLVLDLSDWKGAGLKWADKYLHQGHYVGASLVLAAEALTDGRIGQTAARADLFENSVFCVMPSPQAEPKAVETAVNFGHILGATPYFVDAMEFDGLVQGVETIPGLLAAAMFNAVHKSTGWRDMLRFAGLAFAQTTQPLSAGVDMAPIAMGNKIATLRWLDALLGELQQLRRLVYEGEEDMLTSTLLELDIQREVWLSERAENNWIEIKAPDIEHRGFGEQMFGSLLPRRDPKKKR